MKIITDYFSHIFSTSHPDNFDASLEGIELVVTEAMNEVLDREPTNEEIKAAVCNRHPTKAQGPDGFHALLF